MHPRRNWAYLGLYRKKNICTFTLRHIELYKSLWPLQYPNNGIQPHGFFKSSPSSPFGCLEISWMFNILNLIVHSTINISLEIVINAKRTFGPVFTFLACLKFKWMLPYLYLKKTKIMYKSCYIYFKLIKYWCRKKIE